MAGEGSIQSMIVILRNNRKLLRNRNPFQRRHGFEKLRKDYRKFSQGKVESHPLSKRELQSIRKKIKEENRKDTIKMTLVAVLILIALLSLGIRLYGTLQRNQELIEQKELASKTEQYLFYINDGDKWLNQRHWHNAIFQYLLAKNIFPNEYDVNYRLIMAYGGKCKFEGSGCTDGSELLAKLRRQFPNNKDLQPLEEMLISKPP